MGISRRGTGVASQGSWRAASCAGFLAMISLATGCEGSTARPTPAQGMDAGAAGAAGSQAPPSTDGGVVPASAITHGRKLLDAALRAASVTEPVRVLLVDDRDAVAALSAARAELDPRAESFILLSHDGQTF